MVLEVWISGERFRLDVRRVEDRWMCRIDEREIPVDVVQLSPDRISILLNGKSLEVRRGRGDEVFVGTCPFQVSVDDPRSWRRKKRAGAGESGAQKLTALMPGKVVRILAREGDRIAVGQGIVVVEAMKMQNEIKSPKEGVVHKMLAREGMNVNAGEVLAIVE